MHSSTSKLQHDEAVRVYALQLLSQGFNVRARIEGWFEEPDYVYGYRPDIVAKKNNQFIVVEIRKGDVDWPKISAFTRLRNERDNFSLVVLSPEEAIAKSGSKIRF